MENVHLSRRVDNATNDLYTAINDLICEIEELEDKNRLLELEVQNLQEQLNN